MQDLIKTIKAHIAKGDKAADKAEQHYIAAGQHLKTLKAEHAGSWSEWEELLRRVGIGKSRASELMAIADGTKTLAEVRATTAERTAKAKLSATSGEREAQIEKLRALARPDCPRCGGAGSFTVHGCEASREFCPEGALVNCVCVQGSEGTGLKLPPKDEAKPPPVVEVPPTEASAERDTLLQYARQAGALTKAWRKSRIENDAELSAAANNAAESWREIASALTGWEFDDDDSFYKGAIDKLVARQKRHERKAKKFDEDLEDRRRKEQPGIEALVARLVKLDVDVARQVFNAMDTWAWSFVPALQRALADTQSDAPACATA